MEDGILMIDIQSNYDTEDEGLMDEDNIPDLAKIKDEIRKIKKVIYSHKKKAAKKCDSLIPLCHPLPLEFVGVDFVNLQNF